MTKINFKKLSYYDAKSHESMKMKMEYDIPATD